MNERKNGLSVIVIVCRLGPISTLQKPRDKIGNLMNFFTGIGMQIRYSFLMHVSMPIYVCIGQTKHWRFARNLCTDPMALWLKTHIVFRQLALFHRERGCFVFSSFSFYRFHSLKNPSPRSNFNYLRATDSGQNITNVTVIRYQT